MKPLMPPWPIFGFARQFAEGGTLDGSDDFRAHVKRCVTAAGGRAARLNTKEIDEFALQCHFCRHAHAALRLGVWRGRV